MLLLPAEHGRATTLPSHSLQYHTEICMIWFLDEQSWLRELTVSMETIYDVFIGLSFIRIM